MAMDIPAHCYQSLTASGDLMCYVTKEFSQTLACQRCSGEVDCEQGNAESPDTW